MTRKFTSFSDMAAAIVTKKSLAIRPYRPHLTSSSAIYDFVVGKNYRVIDPMSPFMGCDVSVCDIQTLRRHGYSHVDIHYNNDLIVEHEL